MANHTAPEDPVGLARRCLSQGPLERVPKPSVSIHPYWGNFR